MSDSQLAEMAEERRRYREGIGPFEDFFGNPIPAEEAEEIRLHADDWGCGMLKERLAILERLMIAKHRHHLAMASGDYPERNRQAAEVLDAMAEAEAQAFRVIEDLKCRLRWLKEVDPQWLASLTRGGV